MPIDDCENQRALVEGLAADYRSLEKTTADTEQELARLQAEQAPPETIAAVQGRLAAEQEQLGELTVEGQAAVDEFHAVCGGRPLPTPPWPAR
ncbi:hypothetical protein [Kitasatospora brasiliensis]|uniref:hypothetical protein n=1 Tax=Kitasatospora brasiliensis TaxID=3058040 RepID=UPI00292CDF51|nr:hypothetical protein [Kitasatospora sp. K002]